MTLWTKSKGETGVFSPYSKVEVGQREFKVPSMKVSDDTGCYIWHKGKTCTTHYIKLSL